MPHDTEPARVVTGLLKNGNSANLAVNGSVTPVVFSYSPPTDYDVIIDQFSLLFETSNAIAFGNKFIDTTIATLTNGLLLEAKASDLSFNWQNMKRSRDIIEISKSFEIITGTPNFMRVIIHTPSEFRLVKEGAFSASDYLRLTVRDNLNAFSFAEAHFQGVRL